MLEWLEGESLKDALARNPSGLDADETLRIAAAALDALAFVSSRGLVHRDVKPGNIFLCRDGSVKLIDFEIACHDSGGTTSSTAAVGRGTYDYMAPEFAEEGFRGDGRMDIYALGRCLYEALTGKLGFPRLPSGPSGYSEFFLRARSMKAPDLSDPQVLDNDRLYALLRDMTNPDAGRRIRTAEEVVARLKVVLARWGAFRRAVGLTESWTRRRSRVWTAGSFLLA